MAIKNVVALGFYDVNTIPTLGFGDGSATSSSRFRGAGRQQLIQLLLGQVIAQQQDWRIRQIQQRRSMIRFAFDVLIRSIEQHHTIRNSVILSEV